MTLPSSICEELLASAGFDGLNDDTESSYKKRLRVIRDQMRDLSSDFADGISSESRHSMAYFLYNFPLNFMKTLYVFREISRRRPDFLMPRSRYRILDIGCGEGAGMYGAYYALKSLDRSGKTRLTGIDGSRKMLERARDIAVRLRRRGEDITAGFAKRDLTDMRGSLPRQKYDAIVCSNSLVEIIREEMLLKKYTGILLGHLCENGLLVIIEPALKKYARRLMQLRDGLANHKAAQVILPCVHRENCSLLKIDGRDEWCHESVVWKPPAFLRILNKGLNREIDTLKFAYLVIVRTKSQHVLPEGYRVISNLLREKGKMRIFLCTERGRVELVRLNRSKSRENILFGRIHKGDLIKLHDIVVRKPDYWEVDSQTVVEIL
jgi:ribosomal protein RSM22 (predicted rRNA methylase)